MSEREKLLSELEEVFTSVNCVRFLYYTCKRPGGNIDNASLALNIGKDELTKVFGKLLRLDLVEVDKGKIGISNSGASVLYNFHKNYVEVSQ